MLNRHVAREVDWARFTALRVLGVDEMALTKGHRDFVTMVSARTQHGALAVLAVLPDRTQGQ